MEVYRDNDQYRKLAAEAWMEYSGAQAQRMKADIAADSQPYADKILVPLRLSLLRLQQEVMIADNDTFRAIWDPIQNGLTSMVPHSAKEFNMLQQLTGTPPDKIGTEYSCPFLTAEQQKALDPTVPATIDAPRLITYSTA